MKFSLKTFLFSGFLLSIAGCFGSCKTVIEEPSRFLDPPLSALNTEARKSSQDALQAEQWSINKLNLDEAWTKQSGSRRVKVAVLGTGVDYNHEDLRSNVLVNLAEAEGVAPGSQNLADKVDSDKNGYVDDIVGYDFVENDGFPYDRSGPGTAAAGIIGAVHNNGVGIKGINAEVSLVPVRYIDANGQAIFPNLIKALKYARTLQADVIYLHLANLFFTANQESVRSAEVSALNDALDGLEAADVPVIVNAGNTGANVAALAGSVTIEVAKHRNVFLVTSVDKDDHRPFIANYGMQTVHTSAPGINVMTTLPGHQYGLQSGTYLAAANVAGAVSLTISRHFGKYTTRQIFQALLSSDGSDPLENLELETIGGNRLNVGKLLNTLEQGT